MNIIIGIIGLITSTYIGYMFSLKYVERKKFYNDFFYFNKNLYNQISFNQKTLVNIIGEIKNESSFYNLLKKNILNENYNLILPEYLKNEDKDLFNEYISNLGNSDYITQKKYLTEIETIILSKKNEADSEEKKYKGAYLKLGITIGLIILIILI